MREEIDALHTMGFDPIEVLILPRIVALIIGVPILTFLGSMAALYGGGAGVPGFTAASTPDIFLQRLKEAITIDTFKVGMIKAPFMALVIGIVACVEGLEVKGSAESLGLQTTASVVEVDLPGDRARRLVRHLLRRDRDVSDGASTAQRDVVIEVRDVVVGFGDRIVLDARRSRRLSRRDPRLRRRLGRRQVGADAHHHRPAAAARRHDRSVRRRHGRERATQSARRSSGAGACCSSRARCSPR